ncbi:microtubule-associated proteins 1A/1B light chain 3B-like [Culicoides brevitarsis]|uniref:microtubule-associated proteins 1A/1B light chain 3B-like n=1 Tax=Culicoides brevitarsis TaxID=469753 RepID=UPI00307C4B8F
MNTIEICGAKTKMKQIIRDININYNCKSVRGNHNFKNSGVRRDEAAAIRLKFPTKVPIILEKYHKESDLPHLDKRKFLVPQEVSISQFLCIIRNRMKLSSNKTLFFLINNRSLIPISRTVGEIYEEYKEIDGFLYITYASQEAFGLKMV